VLLRCEHLRIDTEGSVLVDDLSCAIDGATLGLVGDFGAFSAALSGRGRIVSGSFEIAGVDAAVAVSSGTVGLALAEARFNPRWTALDLLTKSASLTGLARKAALVRASGALERLGLPWLGGRAVGTLARPEFLALELAKALLSDPSVVFVQTPLRGLESAEADWLWPLVERCGLGRQLIVSFDSTLLEQRARLLRFEQLLFLHQGRITAQGAPALLLRPASYLVAVTRNAGVLRQALEERGVNVHLSDAADDQPTQLLATSDDADLAQWIVRAAVAHGVPVLELVPLSNARPSGGSDEERAM
jgi:ABC-type multidrug transport system ATPase subunit